MRILNLIILILWVGAGFAQTPTSGYAIVKSRKQPVFLPSEKRVRYEDTTFAINKDLYPIRKNVPQSAANAIYEQTATTLKVFVFPNGGLPALNQITALRAVKTQKVANYRRNRFIFDELLTNETANKLMIIDKGLTVVESGKMNNGTLFYTLSLPRVRLNDKNSGFHYKTLKDDNTLYDRVYRAGEANTTQPIAGRSVAIINSEVIPKYWKSTGTAPGTVNFLTSSPTLKINTTNGAILLNQSDSTRYQTDISGMNGNNGVTNIDADLVTYRRSSLLFPHRYGTLVILKYIGKKLATYPANTSYEMAVGPNWQRPTDTVYLNNLFGNCPLSSILMVVPALTDYSFNGATSEAILNMECPCPDQTCGRPPR